MTCYQYRDLREEDPVDMAKSKYASGEVPQVGDRIFLPLSTTETYYKVSRVLWNINLGKTSLKLFSEQTNRLCDGEFSTSKYYKVGSDMEKKHKARVSRQHLLAQATSADRICEEYKNLISNIDNMVCEVRAKFAAKGTMVKIDTDEQRQVLVNLIEICLEHEEDKFASLLAEIAELDTTNG